MSSRTFTAVDHHVDVVLLAFLASLGSSSASWRAVDAEAHAIPLAGSSAKRSSVLALAVAHHRRGSPSAFAVSSGQREHRVDHLRDGLRGSGRPVVGAERDAARAWSERR